MGHVMGLCKYFHGQTPLPFAGSSRQRPSRVQSLVSSQGSMDSDHLGKSARAGGMTVCGGTDSDIWWGVCVLGWGES